MADRLFHYPNEEQSKENLLVRRGSKWYRVPWMLNGWQFKHDFFGDAREVLLTPLSAPDQTDVQRRVGLDGVVSMPGGDNPPAVSSGQSAGRTSHKVSRSRSFSVLVWIVSALVISLAALVFLAHGPELLNVAREEVTDSELPAVDTGFQPFWVSNYSTTEMWSGPAGQPGVVSFGTTSSQFCVFLVVMPQENARLYVLNPYTNNYFWIDGGAVGPVSSPNLKPAKLVPGRNCSADDVRP